MSDSQTVRVPLGERSYDVRISHGDWPGVISGIASHATESCFIISTPPVWALYGDRLQSGLLAAGVNTHHALMNDGERAKTMATVNDLLDAMLTARLTRKTLVVALGGGVVGDVAGFVAAIYLRGVNFVQVPTTVVAIVDSSVGGKTGVDHPMGKNLIGAFHQPVLVTADTSWLGTLDEHNFHGGLAEVIKYGVIRDAQFFEFLEKNIERILAREPDALMQIVRRSCEIKAEVVGLDEREGGLRAILNFGHTFAHAIEAEVIAGSGGSGAEAMGQESQFHGQAVAMGMVAASLLAEQLGRVDADVRTRLVDLLRRAGLPTQIPGSFDPHALISRMGSDKKVSGGKLRFVLPDCMGNVEIVEVDDAEVVAEAIRSCQRG